MEEIKPPCLNCEGRSITCHSHCDKYLDYAKARKKLTIKEREEKRKERLGRRVWSD
jgi:hypothetical protein